MLTEPQPASLDGVQIRRVRRQEARHDPLRPSQRARCVPAGAIEQHHRMFTPLKAVWAAVEEAPHCRDVRRRGDGRGRPARRWLRQSSNGGEDPHGLAAVLTEHRRYRTPRRADAGRGSLLAASGRRPGRGAPRPGGSSHYSAGTRLLRPPGCGVLAASQLGFGPRRSTAATPSARSLRCSLPEAAPSCLATTRSSAVVLDAERDLGGPSDGVPPPARRCRDPFASWSSG